MNDLLIHIVHLLMIIARFVGPAEAKSAVADNLLMKRILLVDLLKLLTPCPPWGKLISPRYST